MRLGLFRSYSRIIKSSKIGGCCKCFNCLKCLGNGVGLVKCESCGSFQPAPPTQAERTCCPDYYRLLLPREPRPKFDVDMKSLKEGYLALQSIVHPDRAGASIGESWTSWVNRAHATLKDPLQRAIYLLDRRRSDQLKDDKKANFREDDDSLINLNNCDSMHDISEVLEIREEISMTDDPARLEALKLENDERVRKCCEELKKLLDCDDSFKGEEEENFEKVKRWINQLRYWKSIEKELKELIVV